MARLCAKLGSLHADLTPPTRYSITQMEAIGWQITQNPCFYLVFHRRLATSCMYEHLFRTASLIKIVKNPSCTKRYQNIRRGHEHKLYCYGKVRYNGINSFINEHSNLFVHLRFHEICLEFLYWSQRDIDLS